MKFETEKGFYFLPDLGMVVHPESFVFDIDGNEIWECDSLNVWDYDNVEKDGTHMIFRDYAESYGYGPMKTSVEAIAFSEGYYLTE